MSGEKTYTSSEILKMIGDLKPDTHSDEEWYGFYDGIEAVQELFTEEEPIVIEPVIIYKNEIEYLNKKVELLKQMNEAKREAVGALKAITVYNRRVELLKQMNEVL